ncbi:hypothetical protein [Stutzerimonas nosocomialis]|uniref:hypothetical protein n=1 Tax=Stutzerimonas nosocomialis TaxID=1056496 RepID=UPI0013051FDA
MKLWRGTLARRLRRAGWRWCFGYFRIHVGVAADHARYQKDAFFLMVAAILHIVVLQVAIAQHARF